MYFVFVSTQFVIARQRRGELRHARIEKRRAHFQRHRHARAIDFRQNVFSEIKTRVDALHARHEIFVVTLLSNLSRVCA